MRPEFTPRSSLLPPPTSPLRRSYRATEIELGGKRFEWGQRTYVMAILNVTPDSFSGDGLGDDVLAAVALAKEFEAAGADIIDVGGESTRPGAEPLAPANEAARVLPALRAVRAATNLPISIDTCHAAVAEAAIEAGASIVNDITGLRSDPDMASVVARSGAALVAMHNQRGRPFGDVAGDIAAGFEASLAIARQARIDSGRIILDPGFGFGWAPEHNFEMIRRLPELWRFNLPLLIGPSRKSTLGLVLDLPVGDRIEGTAAAVALAIAGGADIVRVHDVRQMARVCRVADAIARDNWRAGPDQVATVVIALGSNLGDRLANLRLAVAELNERGVTVQRCSSAWETEPLPPGQPLFLNAVLVGETGMEPLPLLSLLKTIEQKMGRTEGRRWGPRPIDLDILFYDNLGVESETLTIPHPRIAERAFVLAPLAEVVSGPLPVLGRSARDLLATLDTGGISRLGPMDRR